MSGYSLARACKIVGEIDGSPGRLTVFADIVRKNSLIRTAYAFYNSSPRFIKSYLLLLYGLKCYLTAHWRGPVSPDIVFFASTPNEQVALAHVRRHLAGLTTGRVGLARASCFSLDSLRALPAFLARVRRLRRVARRLARRSHFLPACRIFSTITYYLRFLRVLEDCGTNAVFIANHYSPESLALAAAAHRSGRKVVCTNHANGTWQVGYVPALHSDLVAVTSQAILDAYCKHSRRELNTVFIPQASPQRPMRSCVDPARPVTVGIFLTALTRMERLHALVSELKANPLVARILIRSHPVKVVNDDLAGLTARGDHVEDSSNSGLFDNIARCDLAICGNSSVTVEVLRGGVPVFYDDGLDAITFDCNGYLRRGLILPLPAVLNSAALAAARRFYGDPFWAQVMHYFDAGYQEDEGAMFRALHDALRVVVRAPEPAEAALLPLGAAADASRPAVVS